LVEETEAKPTALVVQPERSEQLPAKPSDMPKKLG
jgi:hypothetical protein